MASEFKTFSLNKVLREKNYEPNALANLGCCHKIPPEVRIPITCILILTIKDPSNNPDGQKINEDPDPQLFFQNHVLYSLNIKDPTQHSKSWIHPIVEYLKISQSPKRKKTRKHLRWESHDLSWSKEDCNANMWKVYTLDA